MDPITAAIVSALPALATDAIKSAYEGLKAVIRRKWGETSPIAKAVTGLEDDPTSKAQVAVLEEKVGAVNAVDDSEVLQALHKLIKEMRSHYVGGEQLARFQFNMSGGIVQGIAGAEKVNMGAMNFGTPPKL